MKFDILTSFMQEGPLTFDIKGGCMQAVLPDGSQVRVERRGWYVPGDIVTFRRGENGIATHRILGYVPGRGGWRILTRADEAQRADAPVPLACVLGRVTGIDGHAYRPGLRDRLRALGIWPLAALTWMWGRHAG